MKNLALAFALSLCTVYGSAQQTRILFIGNSYTAANNLPELTRQLALSLGDTVIVSSSTPGGYTFNSHLTNVATMTAIRQGNWDYVVLQEQSQLPSFAPSQVNSASRPYAMALVDSIRVYSPCAEPVFYMTWGRQNGDDQNCASWPPVCTYEGMQGQLRMSYLSFAEENMAWCAPVGATWAQIRAQFPAIDLYATDGSHPSLNGSYLAACTMYCTMFAGSTVGAGYTAGLDANTSAILQQMATTVVLDSTDIWNIGASDPDATITITAITTNEFGFSGTSANGIIHSWEFGDGITATNGAVTHTYTGSGEFTVIHTVTDACGRMTADTVQVNAIASGVQELTAPHVSVTSDALGIQISTHNNTGTIAFFDTKGTLVGSYSLKANEQRRIALTSGQPYVWKFSSSKGFTSGKVVVN